MTTNISQNPFVLLARITVKKGCVEDYLRIAAAADVAVEKSEPGMLLHSFDADPDDDHKFVWTEKIKSWTKKDNCLMTKSIFERKNVFLYEKICFLG